MFSGAYLICILLLFVSYSLSAPSLQRRPGYPAIMQLERKVSTSIPTQGLFPLASLRYQDQCVSITGCSIGGATLKPHIMAHAASSPTGSYRRHHYHHALHYAAAIMAASASHQCSPPYVLECCSVPASCCETPSS